MQRQGPVLITGASGYLGSHLCQAWGDDTVGVSRSQPSVAGEWRALDLRDPVATGRLLDDVAPRAIVHCAAAQAGASSDDLASVNVDASQTLAAWCEASGARLVALSSDMVHGGRAGPYDDHASPTPLTAYGRTKADGERRTLGANPTAAVVRTSLIFGVSSIDRGTAGLAARLDAGEVVTLWQDVLRQPMEITALADALVALIDRPDVHGVINIAGRDVVSRADFAMAMLRHWGRLNPTNEGQVSLISLGEQTSVPLDLRLRCDRAGRLGIRMPGVSQVVATE